MTAKALIFDLDGTIASFNLDYRTVRAEVRSLLIREGIPPSVLSINESIFEMLKKVEIFLKNTGKSGKAIEEINRKALAIAEKYELEAAKTTSLLPGVNETLKTLKKMKLKMGLCTINGEKSTDYILKRFKIADYFSAVVSRNRVIHVKPNSEHLEMALKALHVKPDEALVVGDGKSDMKCASDLKVIAVGLPTGVSTNEDLMRAGANYLITSIKDLPTLIESINKTSEN